MGKNELMSRYLETAPIGQAGGISEIKIKWIKYNFLKFFPGKEKVYLDIGPGQGETLVLWKELGYQNIKSVDISQDVCQHIQQLGFDCSLVSSTTDFLNDSKEKFDFIMLNDVVEHIPKDELVDFVQAVCRGLRGKGRVIIKVPNAQSPHFSIGRYADLTHVQSFTESSLEQLLLVGGFKKFQFYAEDQPSLDNSNIKILIGKYIIMPIYFWWIRKIRSATYHLSPEILTQAIIAVAEKE